MLYGAFKDGRVAFIDCDDIAACGAALLTGSGKGGETGAEGGVHALTGGGVALMLAATGRGQHLGDCFWAPPDDPPTDRHDPPLGGGRDHLRDAAVQESRCAAADPACRCARGR